MTSLIPCAGIAKLQAGSFDEAAVAAKVDSLIADNPVVVFSWTRWGLSSASPFMLICISPFRILHMCNAHGSGVFACSLKWLCSAGVPSA